MPKLYELTQTYQRVLQVAEDEDSLGEWDAALGDIQDAIQDKAQGIAKIIRMLEADAKVAQEEADRLNKLAKGREDRARFLKQYLSDAFEIAGIKESLGPLFKIRLQDSNPACYVDDEDKVAKEWKRHIPERWEIDKRAILDAWKASGEIVPGCRIERGKHIRIY